MMVPVLSESSPEKLASRDTFNRLVQRQPTSKQGISISMVNLGVELCGKG